MTTPPRVTLSGPDFDALAHQHGETALDTLLRHGIATPFSCRGGTCHSCIRRCTEGRVPAQAQRGLSADLVALGYFLPCVCYPTEAMRMDAPRPVDFTTPCRVEAADVLDEPTAVLVQLEPLRTLTAEVGDHFEIDLPRGQQILGEALTVPQEAFFLTLQVDCAPHDAQHIANELHLAGDALRIRPAANVQIPGLPEVPSPDAALWTALEDGAVLRKILDDFYTRVFADERLAPYFRGTTQEHVAGKQYGFLRRAFTGENVYFGDSPRNAHHWMVIPHELFEHRQELMRATLRSHGLSDKYISRWEAHERAHRDVIVKSRPVPRQLFGQELPLEGFKHEELSVGSVCDGCKQAVDAGECVRYHVRLGTISCRRCSPIGETT